MASIDNTKIKNLAVFEKIKSKREIYKKGSSDKKQEKSLAHANIQEVSNSFKEINIRHSSPTNFSNRTCSSPESIMAQNAPFQMSVEDKIQGTRRKQSNILITTQQFYHSNSCKLLDEFDADSTQATRSEVDSEINPNIPNSPKNSLSAESFNADSDSPDTIRSEYRGGKIYTKKALSIYTEKQHSDDTSNNDI